MDESINDNLLTPMSSETINSFPKKSNMLIYAVLIVVFLIIIGVIIYLIFRQQSVSTSSTSTSSLSESPATYNNSNTIVSHSEELTPTTVSHSEELSKTNASHPEELSKTTVSHSEELSKTTVSHSEELTHTTVSHSEEVTPTTVLHSEEVTPTTVLHSEELSKTTVSHSEELTPTTVSHSEELSKIITIPEESLIYNFASTGVNNVKCTSLTNCAISQGSGNRNILNNVLYTSQLKNGAPLPMIMIGINSFDSDNKKSKECNVLTQNTNNIGFTINTQVNGDTMMYGFGTSWLAISNKFGGFIQSKIININCNPIKTKSSVNDAPFSLTFDKHFAGTPLIFMAFTKIDTENNENQRIAISNIQSSPTGVTGSISRYGKSRVYDASIMCIAVDPISSLSMTNQLYKLYNIQTGISNSTLNNSTLNNTDSTPRSFVTDVLFVLPYSTIPMVSVALTGISSSNKANERINIYVDNITTTGFKLNIQTWSNSYIGMANASWMAYA